MLRNVQLPLTFDSAKGLAEGGNLMGLTIY
jgi:hypothetical protein